METFFLVKKLTLVGSTWSCSFWRGLLALGSVFLVKIRHWLVLELLVLTRSVGALGTIIFCQLLVVELLLLTR